MSPHVSSTEGAMRISVDDAEQLASTFRPSWEPSNSGPASAAGESDPTEGPRQGQPRTGQGSRLTKQDTAPTDAALSIANQPQPEGDTRHGAMVPDRSGIAANARASTPSGLRSDGSLPFGETQAFEGELTGRDGHVAPTARRRRRSSAVTDRGALGGSKSATRLIGLGAIFAVIGGGVAWLAIAHTDSPHSISMVQAAPSSVPPLPAADTTSPRPSAVPASTAAVRLAPLAMSAAPAPTSVASSIASDTTPTTPVRAASPIVRSNAVMGPSVLPATHTPTPARTKTSSIVRDAPF